MFRRNNEVSDSGLRASPLINNNYSKYLKVMVMIHVFINSFDYIFTSLDIYEIIKVLDNVIKHDLVFHCEN